MDNWWAELGQVGLYTRVGGAYTPAPLSSTEEATEVRTIGDSSITEDYLALGKAELVGIW